jgi:NRPS condensation-like uncharacterized protein
MRMSLLHTSMYTYMKNIKTFKIDMLRILQHAQYHIYGLDVFVTTAVTVDNCFAKALTISIKLSHVLASAFSTATSKTL